MTHHPADHSPHSSHSESDCLQAEFVSAVEPNTPTNYAADVFPMTESALATLEPTLQATDSFEFNYVDRPVTPPQVPSEPPDSSEILARLFTPWSLGGLFLLIVANGLLTMYSISHRATPPVAINSFSELPPINSIPPHGPNPSGPSLAVNHLSEVSPSQTSPSPVVSPTQSFSAALPTSPPPITAAQSAPPLPPPPSTVSLASRLFPPAINPQQAMMPPSNAPVGGYPTYSTARANAPQPPQPPNVFPTVSVRPVYQFQPSSPLPPPPPPPLSQASVSAPSEITPPSLTPNPVQNVEIQMRQQLPNQTTSGATSTSNSFNQPSQPPGTRSYNQGSGTTQAGTPPTQQLVQELESLNQAP